VRRNALAVFLVGLALLAQSFAPLADARPFHRQAGVQTCSVKQDRGESRENPSHTRGDHRHCGAICFMCEGAAGAPSDYVETAIAQFSQRREARAIPAGAESRQRLGENPNAPVRAGPFLS
jgi:hypothetical protein